MARKLFTKLVNRNPLSDEFAQAWCLLSLRQQPPTGGVVPPLIDEDSVLNEPAVIASYMAQLALSKTQSHRKTPAAMGKATWR